MAASVVGFEPDPLLPGAGTAKLSDGRTMYGRHEDFQPYFARPNQSAEIVQSQPTPVAPPQPREIQDVTNLPLTADSKPNPQAPSMLSYGYRALGATPQDVAALEALQASGRNIDLPTLLAAKKTQMVGGTPAINANTEANQIAWRTGKQTVTEGVKPVDEERWAKVQDLAQQSVEAQARAQYEEGQASVSVAQAQAQAAQQLHDQMKMEQARQEQDYQSRHQALLQELDDTSKSEPDQRRWFDQHGALGTITALIGSAVQGYGMGLHGQFGPSMLERFVNNDIALQERAIERRGAAARNKLADLSQQWGSVEAGRAALKASQLRLAESQLAQLQATARQPAIAAKIEAQRTDLQKSIAEADYNLRAASMGTTKTAESAAFVQPRRATTGGARTTYNLNQALESQRADFKASKEGSQGENSIQGRAERLGKELVPLEEVLASVNELAPAVGLVRGKSGKWEQATDNPMHGPVDVVANAVLPESWNTERTRKAQYAKEQLVEAVGRLRSQGAINAEEAVRFREQIQGNSEAGQREALNQLERTMQARAIAAKGGAGREATQLYEYSRKQAARDTKEDAKFQGGFQPINLQVNR